MNIDLATIGGIAGAVITYGIIEFFRPRKDGCAQQGANSPTTSSSPTDDKQTNPILPTENSIQGLGGWLIFVGFGILTDPLLLIFRLSSFLTAIDTLDFATAFSPRNEGTSLPYIYMYMHALSALVVAQVFGWIYVAFLFFAKKKLFAKWYITVSALSLISILITIVAASLTAPSEPESIGSISEFVYAIGYRIIFIRYMMVSMRVKNTFLR